MEQQKIAKEEEEKAPGGRISSHAPSSISLGHAGQVTCATLHVAEGCGEKQTLTKQGKSNEGTCKSITPLFSKKKTIKKRMFSGHHLISVPS